MHSEPSSSIDFILHSSFLIILMHIAVFSQYHTNPDCPATSRHYTLLAHIAKTHRVTLLTTPAWEGQRLTQSFLGAGRGGNPRGRRCLTTTRWARRGGRWLLRSTRPGPCARAAD